MGLVLADAHEGSDMIENFVTLCTFQTYYSTYALILMSVSGSSPRLHFEQFKQRLESLSLELGQLGNSHSKYIARTLSYAH